MKMGRYVKVLGMLVLVSPLLASTSLRISEKPKGGAQIFQAGDTLLYENFDAISPGELPEGWDTVDLTGLPAPAYWHIDSVEAYSGTHAWWCGQWYSMTGPGYGDLWRQYLTLDIDLTGVSAPCSLSFRHRYDAEYEQPQDWFDAWDGMNVRISTDGGTTWEVIEPEGGYPYQAIYAFYLQDGDSALPGYSNFADWNSGGVPTFDLSPYVGQAVKIRWWFASDMYCSDESFCDFYGAWFIDDILITSGQDTVFFDDVESGVGQNWTAEGLPAFITGNFWHVVDSSTQPQPDGRPVFYTGPNAAYCGDPNSSRGDGTYTPADHLMHGLQSALVTPSMDLSDVNLAMLDLMERTKGDGAGGYGYIDISTDGGDNWIEVDMRVFAPSGGDWSSYTFPLAIATGYEDVKVRFRTGSGTGGNHYVYWYIDDVVVTGSGTQCASQNDDDNAVAYWGDMFAGEIAGAKLDNCITDSNGLVKKVSFYLYNPPPGGTNTTDFAVHIYKDAEGEVGEEMIVPETVSVEISTQMEWIHVEISDTAAFQPGESFWAGIEMLSDSPTLFLLMDGQASSDRNKIFNGVSWESPPPSFGDFMIRVTMDTTSIIDVRESVPQMRSPIYLSSRPNPIREGSGLIEFSLDRDYPVELVIYNAAGQRVKTLVSLKLKRGRYEFSWDGRNERGLRVSSGVYFVSLKAGDRTFVKKLTLLR